MSIIGICACCGCEISSDEYHTRIDGELYCDYCAGEDGLTASELLEEQNGTQG